MSGEPLATLRISGSQERERSVELAEGETIRVGRDDHNDLILADEGVSRAHAIFSASENGVVLADLGSTNGTFINGEPRNDLSGSPFMNGTFINGEPLKSLRDLRSGDVVDIGATKIVVEVHNPAEGKPVSGEGVIRRSMTAQMKPLSVTVLVTTVINYNRYLRELSSIEVADMLERWSDMVTAVVEGMEGRLDKAVGGSLVALWTGNNAGELARNAVGAATKIRTVTLQLSQKADWLAHHASHPWNCTAVLSSGAGLEGKVGDNKGGVRSFSILGDPINTAFRLEEVLGRLGQHFIVAESTAKLVEEYLPLRKVIGVNLRVDGDPIQIYAPC